MQSRDELENFWSKPDPWGFRSHPDDAMRRAKLLAVLALTGRDYSFAIDLGCGDGFLTEVLPASVKVGIDLSSRAVLQATARAHDRRDVSYQQGSIFDIRAMAPADLIVASGVLYEQYLGDSAVLVGQLLANQLQPGGDLVIQGIDSWLTVRPPLLLMHHEVYPYREYTHRLEVWRRL